MMNVVDMFLQEFSVINQIEGVREDDPQVTFYGEPLISFFDENSDSFCSFPEGGYSKIK